jgi:hypothetical protein
MTLISYQEIPPELDTLYKKALQSGDRFTFSRIRVKKLFSSRAKKKGLTEKSLIVLLAPVWATFDSATKLAWNNAGLVIGLTGFKLFIKDTGLRMKNEMAGYSMPSLLHQARFGRLHIEAPATNIKITQLHPLNYWVQKKVRGTRDQFEPVKITESFDLPLDIKISYKANLTASGALPSATFYCEVYSNYQGETIITPCTIYLVFSTDWREATASISSVVGVVRGYSAFIKINDARGDLYIDNVEINHSGLNWARDPACNEIDQSFTKAFFQIPKHWEAISVPSGAQFDSFFE